MSRTALQTLSHSKKPIANRKFRLSDRADKRWVSGRDKERKIDDSQIALFGRLLYERLKDGSIVKREQIARLVNRCTNGAEITERMASAWISKVRVFFIKEYKETIIYLREDGESVYKIAKGYEKPLRVAKSGYAALKWKDRFMQEVTILNHEDMKLAGSALITRIQKDLGHDNKGLMIESAKSDMKLLRAQIS